MISLEDTERSRPRNYMPSQVRWIVGQRGEEDEEGLECQEEEGQRHMGREETCTECVKGPVFGEEPVDRESGCGEGIEAETREGLWRLSDGTEDADGQGDGCKELFGSVSEESL